MIFKAYIPALHHDLQWLQNQANTSICICDILSVKMSLINKNTALSLNLVPWRPVLLALAIFTSILKDM
jgi:hypothetical protein